MKVTIVEYRREWSGQFARERDELAKVLGETAAVIEHIGSTSVPDLAARAIIDIMVGLESFVEADGLVVNITRLGYVYIPEYEDVMPQRRYFQKIREESTSFHLHMIEKGGAFWERHLLFRGYLRENRSVADEYGLLKKRLAKLDWNVSNDFAQAKTDFIRSVEEQAKVSGDAVDLNKTDCP